MASFRSSEDSGIGSTSHVDISLEKSKPQKCTKFHIAAFFVTFVSYALFHVTRKTFSNVKTTMSAVWSPFNTSYPDIYDYEQWNSHHMYENASDASLFLGTLDTAFMISYSVGLYISGALGDRFDLRKVLSFGMCSSAITVFIFGTVSEWTHTYNQYAYVVFWCATGLLQSTGWPTVVAVIGNWFGKSSRGLVMGFWGASPSIGNIVGAYVVAGVLHYGYQYAFLVPACMTFVGGIIVYFSLIPSPRDVGLPDAEEDELTPQEEPLLRKDASVGVERTISQRPDAIGFCSAFCLPGVLAYSLAYACLKLVNYSFFFWLPYYLQSAYGWQESEADKLSVWYDVGGIVGGIIGGYISDKIGTRSPIVGVMLVFAPVSLFIYSVSPADEVTNALLMSLTGFFIGGVANLISTAISADLGRQKEIANSKEALATVTGIIDGTGSAGAAAGQLLIPLLQKRVGWHVVFYFFIVLTIMTLLFILRIIIHDVRDLWNKRKVRETAINNINDDFETAESD